MSRLTLATALSMAIAGVFAEGSAEPPQKAAPELNQAAKAVNAFCVDLYTNLGEKEGNLFFSPYSLSTALGMTYAGARGNTAAEMAATLHFPAGDAVHPMLGALARHLDEDPGPCELHVANALWCQRDYRLLAEFLEVAENNYRARASQMDFVADAEGARRTINAWVEDQTKERIKDLIGPGVLDALTRLVLTNAIYFKGQWMAQFDESRTMDGEFRVSPMERVQAPLMRQSDRFGYRETDGLQILELPYAGANLSMVVLLPREVDGLASLENGLTPAKLDEWLGGLVKQEVAVTLPRFKLTSEFELGDVLARMGMPEAFTFEADFSGMSGSKDLYISAVLHKAFVDVNEEGTEAAAATAVVMRQKSAPVRPKEFVADRPFIFLIRDVRSGAILFAGRLVDPSA